jgi:hypothetical protein
MSTLTPTVINNVIKAAKIISLYSTWYKLLYLNNKATAVQIKNSNSIFFTAYIPKYLVLIEYNPNR